MVDVTPNGNGNGRRFQMTVSLGSVIQIVTMIGAIAVIYAQIERELGQLEVKVDNLTSWVRGIANHRGDPIGPPQ